MLLPDLHASATHLRSCGCRSQPRVRIARCSSRGVGFFQWTFFRLKNVHSNRLWAHDHRQWQGCLRPADNRGRRTPPPPRPKGPSWEMYRWENLIGPYLVHTLLGPRPPSPLLSTNASLVGGPTVAFVGPTAAVSGPLGGPQPPLGGSERPSLASVADDPRPHPPEFRASSPQSAPCTTVGVLIDGGPERSPVTSGGPRPIPSPSVAVAVSSGDPVPPRPLTKEAERVGGAGGFLSQPSPTAHLPL